MSKSYLAFNENGDLNSVEIVFSFTVQPQSISTMKLPFLTNTVVTKTVSSCITLSPPSIGFGTKAYRTLFSETMVHNSGCKEKKRKDLPSNRLSL